MADGDPIPDTEAATWNAAIEAAAKLADGEADEANVWAQSADYHGNARECTEQVARGQCAARLADAIRALRREVPADAT